MNFLTLLLNKLLTLHDAREKAVRLRVCQLVGALLCQAAETRCRVGSGVLEATQNILLLRTSDRVGNLSLVTS